MTPEQQSAMRQAFDALANLLESHYQDNIINADCLEAEAAITALREALAEQPAQPSKPLTDEQIDEMSRTMVKGNKSVNWLCRSIEAYHGIKENT